MTRIEAIERIKSIKSKVSLYDDVVALRMAEEALDIQKTVIVELETVKSKIQIRKNDYLVNYGVESSYTKGLDKAIEIIDSYISELKGERK